MGERLEEMVVEAKKGTPAADLLVYIELALSEYKRFDISDKWGIS